MSADFSGRLPLHHATMGSREEIVQILLATAAWKQLAMVVRRCTWLAMKQS